MIELHEQHLRAFLDTWRRAKAAEVALPETEDPSYASLESLLVHVLACARSYMVWMCEQLELPNPKIDPAPSAAEIEAEAERYLDHVVAGWLHPLKDVPEEHFEDREYRSRWNVLYCIDAMLEHAVMHPIRHEHQLARLMESQSS